MKIYSLLGFLTVTCALLSGCAAIVGKEYDEYFNYYYQNYDYDSDYLQQLLDFEVTQSEWLTPLVTLTCYHAEILSSYLPPNAPPQQMMETLAHSICKNLGDEKIDQEWLKQCLRDSSCMKSQNSEFLAGLEDFKLFYYYNSSTTDVEDEGNDKLENAASDLSGKWNYLSENCAEYSGEDYYSGSYNNYYWSANDLMGSLYDNEGYYGGEGYEGDNMFAQMKKMAVDMQQQAYMLGRAQSECMKYPLSAEVKRNILNGMDATAACMPEVSERLMEYLSSNDDNVYPFDTTMEVTRMLLNCENETLALMVEDMLKNGDSSQYQAGYAMWTMIKQMTAEREQLKRMRREAVVSNEDFDNWLSELSSAEELYKKWETTSEDNPRAPTVYSYAIRRFDEETAMFVGQVVDSYLVTVGGSDDTPLTIKYEEIHDHPKKTNQFTFAVESPLLAKFVNGEPLEQVIQSLLNDKNVMSTVKVSMVSKYMDVDYSSEDFQSMLAQYGQQVARLLESVMGMPQEGEMKIQFAVGDSITLKHSTPQDDTLRVEMEVVDASYEDYEGQVMYSVMDLKTTENEYGELGNALDGKFVMWGSETYAVNAVYDPPTVFRTADKTCELTLNIRDENWDEDMLKWSSCSRPVYLQEPDEMIVPVSNMYQNIEIADWFKLNLTVDFGENGYYGLMSSPKTVRFLFKMGELSLDMGGEMSTVNNRMDDRPENLLMQTLSVMFLKVYGIDYTPRQEFTLTVNSDIFNDLTSSSNYDLKTFVETILNNGYYDYSKVPSVLRSRKTEESTSEGVMHVTSCARQALNLPMMMISSQTGSEPEIPDELCFDLSIVGHENMWYQRYRWNTESGVFSTNYTVDLQLYESSSYSMNYDTGLYEDYKYQMRYQEEGNFTLNTVTGDFWAKMNTTEESTGMPFVMSISSAPWQDEEMPLEHLDGVQIHVANNVGAVVVYNFPGYSFEGSQYESYESQSPYSMDYDYEGYFNAPMVYSLLSLRNEKVTTDLIVDMSSQYEHMSYTSCGWYDTELNCTASYVTGEAFDIYWQSDYDLGRVLNVSYELPHQMGKFNLSLHDRQTVSTLSFYDSVTDLLLGNFSVYYTDAAQPSLMNVFVRPDGEDSCQLWSFNFESYETKYDQECFDLFSIADYYTSSMDNFSAEKIDYLQQFDYEVMGAYLSELAEERLMYVKGITDQYAPSGFNSTSLDEMYPGEDELSIMLNELRNYVLMLVY